MAADHILIGNTTSPFVRKVMAFAIAAGVDNRLNVRQHDMAVTFAENPLGKIPALVSPDGFAVIESELIIAALDQLRDGESLLTSDRAAQQRRAIASGALDCAVARIYEARRPEDKQWDAWDQKQKTKIEAALDVLEAQAGALSADREDAETTTIGVLLGYLDFRFAADAWRDGRPSLTAWFEAFSAKPSMAKTTPVDPKAG